MPTRVETVVCACGQSYRSKLRRGKTTACCPQCGRFNQIVRRPDGRGVVETLECKKSSPKLEVNERR